MSGIEKIVGHAEICICAGAGGVGKTSTSAAIALGAARRGRKTAVLTIDPAKRLANALGLERLGNEPRRVPGVDGDGELWAMMLDAKRTFDELVDSYAPDQSTRDAVLSNRIYQELSGAVSGSQEYMAMEKLYELHMQGNFDLLVLDTPPTRNALDFLDSPERLHRFIDSRSLRFFLSPGVKLLGRGSGLLFAVLQRVTGIDLLRDLSDFFRAFGDMSEGFRARAERVNELLGSKAATFVLVAAPRHDAIDDAIFFHDQLEARGMPFGGVVVNRFHDARGGKKIDLEAALGADLAAKVETSYDDYRVLADRDRKNLRRLTERLSGEPVIVVPELDGDVHDLEGLAQMVDHLY
ncbi:MAG TPA: ArsA-related P-loop ATPase [Thermoleophilaceae bacterium]|nr:ArsA-related P-loop ATPase [Thermoleophilaceae bacterium]